jgi:HEAT repeat protein
MIERFNIPSRAVPGKLSSSDKVPLPGRLWLCLAMISASVALCSCTSVSQMQQRYEAGDETQLDKISEIALRQDYPYATRRSAARALGEIGDSRSIPVLVSLLGEFDKRTTLKEEALIALGRTGDAQAVTGIGRLLDRSLNDTNEELRVAAMPVLGKLGGSEAATILVNALSYYDIVMLTTQQRAPRGVFSGDEQSMRDLQDSMRAIQRSGEQAGYGGGSGGSFGTTSGMFGGSMALPDERKLDTTPQERALAHASLVRVGDPAVPVIHEYMSQRETTITLRNELQAILQEIRGEVPTDPVPSVPAPTDPG